ncbi:5-formyltetrahydrofolate cyclo-ligase [Pelagibacterales bacterium SAG-MED10]|nr:5-formyltetrahydrofolate cyclo-ligase [Pelagibacterales bacterium SAG-MED10]
MIKSKLRDKVLKLRKSKSKKSINISPSNIYSYLKKKNYNLKIIGGYYPSNYEINDLKILNFFFKRGSSISLPKIKKKNQMEFYKWYKNDPLLINKYGILEPDATNKVYPDILFVPLVAFDKKLNRLGYGGGFYDRYIQKISKIKKVVKVGLAFSFQKLKTIPVNKYDKKLDIIITEKEII